MTYVEFFDKTAIENVATCLAYMPDRVVFLSDNAKRCKKYIECYREVFQARGHNVEFEARGVSKTKLDEAIKALERVVTDYDDCIFDVTGGDELLMLALGIVCASHPEKKIQVHKVSVQNNKIYDYDRNGTTTYQASPSLTVSENIRIYGGRIVYETNGVERTNVWDLNEEFRQDVAQLWDLCKRSGRFWNVQIGTFASIETIGKKSADGLTTVTSQFALKKYLDKHGFSYAKIRDILDPLMEQGFITHFDDSGEDTITITYKNRQIKKCLIRAGQVLEMKVFIAVTDAKDDAGNPVYQDAMNGVVIDWDGEFHNELAGEAYDTENEVDIMLMHDIVPVFISCKNGQVTADELYKIQTISQRFGGDYAKKVLVATALDALGDASNYLRQRAEDMDIHIIDNIQDISDEELLSKVATLWDI